MVGKPNQVVPKAGLQPIPASDEPFSRITIDCVDPLPKTKSGNEYLLTIMCGSTRFPEAIPLRNIKTKTIVRALVKFFTFVGLPKSVQSDQVVNFPFLDGDVPRSASYGVYISQLIRFARVSSHVDDFNTRNKVLTAKLLRQGYRYHKLRKAFSKFYRRHFDIVSKYNVGLKTLLLQGLSEPEFYGDLVYKFRKIIGKIDFPYHFKKIIVRYKKIGYNINVMRQTACLVVNPIKVNSFAYLFNCTTVGRTSD